MNLPFAPRLITHTVQRTLRVIRDTFSGRIFRSRVQEVTEVCQRAASGDLEARISGVSTRSDFGKMCHAINRVLDVSDSFVREAAAAMDNCSRDRFHRPILLRGMSGAYRSSAMTINAAARTMKEHSDSIGFVAQQAEETATSVLSVAAACDELDATSTVISRETDAAAAETKVTAQQIKLVNASLHELQDAVAKIGKVVELINSVAVQTNLLGLNATIEAAHAGEHGSGFAVVAAEVKTLSDETRHATQEIAEEMLHIQNSVASVASSIGEITRTITDFDHTVGSIAVSVGEQLKATKSINASITAVSQSADEISERIKQARENRASGATA